jgi:hypothetical protein
MLTKEQYARLSFEEDDGNGMRLGSTLAGRISQKVIAVVALLMIILPFLDPGEDNQDYVFATRLLHDISRNTTFSHAQAITDKRANHTALSAAIQTYMSNLDELGHRPYLLRLEVSPHYSGYIINLERRLRLLRANQKLEISFRSPDVYNSSIIYETSAIFSNESTSRLLALYGIALVIVISAIMMTGSAVLYRDAKVLVLDPLQRILRMVHDLASNPLGIMADKKADGDSDKDSIRLSISSQQGQVRVMERTNTDLLNKEFEMKLLETYVTNDRSTYKLHNPNKDSILPVRSL